MITLQLFSTLGCHLCDLAADEIAQLQSDTPLKIVVVEIGDNDELVEQYGTRIPVVRFPDNSELNWPFSQNDILAKIQEI